MKHSTKLSWRKGIYVICLTLFVQSCILEEDNPPDDDGDGIENAVDLCPNISNPNQEDADEDGIGDACETDIDKDGVIDDIDNCPSVANPDQKDGNEDGIGDVCEGDTDEDGVIDYEDNCPDTPNPDQADANEDGIGDVCEGDDDEDGIPNYLDNCPETPNEDQADFDDDGMGDVCDETSTTEDKTHITSALDQTFNCIRNLKNGEGIDLIMEDLLSFSGGEPGEVTWVDALVENLSMDLFENLEEKSSIGLYLDEIGGVYAFSKSDSSWTKNSSSTTRLELQFPSAQGVSSNNTSIILEDYAEDDVTIGEEVYNLPTSASLSLQVDDVELMAIRINEVTYGTGDLPVPSKADVELFVKPTTFHVVLESPVANQYSLHLDVSNAEGCSYGVIAEVELAHDDFENIIFEEDIESLTAEVYLGHLSIKTASDLAPLLSLTDPTEEQINDLVDLDLYVNGFKIADVEYSETDETVYLIFKDESREDGLNYFEDFVNDVIGLIEDYTGDLGDLFN
ncbi:Thrombospondin type 3 repeat-containing protein [Reichenbachiella faecimaris]|uniref:Thrombospondin type 3 repeat-containing protein n=1 Tax=Reichenbachiella faecimaris TaxID=692418 RepID=A0A1W2G8I2_REIFA|nr:thrombospondin type 3 repeat-containing protein [Reichenbachiella faecimaris]SMD32995.1 Thrombospondin type 3 repeat-containing protein [Reichenbachiella faecimaris]